MQNLLLGCRPDRDEKLFLVSSEHSTQRKPFEVNLGKEKGKQHDKRDS